MNKIGFVGLGNMGYPMALNLLKAGYAVTGINRSKAAQMKLAEAGGAAGTTPAVLAADSEAVLTCLPLPADVEQVYLGEEGLIAGGKPGLLLIDCSTVSPELNRRIYAAAEEAGIRFLDAPVSGGTTGAEAGTLTVMAGGDEEAFRLALPVLEAIGRNIRFVGASGNGTVVKLINQLMVAAHTMAAGEALLLAERMGLDAELLFEILDGSFAQSRILERHYRQFISQGKFDPGFAVKLLFKDVSLVRQMASSAGMALPGGEHAFAQFEQAVAEGYGDLDMAGMYRYLGSRSGMTPT